eukprot:4026886-Pyramimonas_sp.AAC.1
MDPDQFPVDAFQPIVETCNVSGWGSAQRWLQRTPAHIVLMQEHRISDDQLASASSWSIRHGWKSLFLPADKGPHGGPSAGVAILVRS